MIFQLQIVSPLFMIAFKKSSKFGYIFNFLVLPFACFATIAPTLIYDLKLFPFEVSELYKIEDLKYSLIRFFTFTDQYLSLFIIGIIVGYFLRPPQGVDKLLRGFPIRLSIGIICYTISVLGIVWSENFKEMNQK